MKSWGLLLTEFSKTDLLNEMQLNRLSHGTDNIFPLPAHSCLPSICLPIWWGNLAVSHFQKVGPEILDHV